MVKATELRVGNWMEDINGEYFQISGNDIKMLHELGMMMFMSNPPKPAYNRITLTSDILDKCGLEPIDDAKTEYRIVDLRLRQFGESSWFIKRNGFDLYPGMLLIMYLHQLQNIIFYLTGKELNIDL